MDQLIKMLMEQHGLSQAEATKYAQGMLSGQGEWLPIRADNRGPVQPQNQIPRAPIPVFQAAQTPAHQEDATLSAWQRYADMIEAQNPSVVRTQ